jgi:protein kinase A
MLASESRMPSVMSGADRCSRFDRYQEADVSDYGKAGSGPHDHFFTEF